MWDLFLVTLIPLVLFVIVDYRAGLKSGVMTAIASSFALGGFVWYLLGELDEEFIIMIIALAATGFVSIKKNNPIFIKMQPVITNSIGFLFLGWYQFFDTPIMIKYLPKVGKLLPPEQVQALSAPEMQPFLVRVSASMMVCLIVHSIIVGYAAVKARSSYWLLAKAIGTPFIAIGAFALTVVWSRISP
jgi:intracellular septation protein A